jgi:hypothetical protein
LDGRPSCRANVQAAKQSGDSKKNQKKVADNTKRAAKGKGGGKGKRGGGDDDAGDAGDASAPRKWNDYTVNFTFPEPTELQPPLIQASRPPRDGRPNIHSNLCINYCGYNYLPRYAACQMCCVLFWTRFGSVCLSVSLPVCFFH